MISSGWLVDYANREFIRFSENLYIRSTCKARKLERVSATSLAVSVSKILRGLPLDKVTSLPKYIYKIKKIDSKLRVTYPTSKAIFAVDLKHTCIKRPFFLVTGLWMQWNSNSRLPGDSSIRGSIYFLFIGRRSSCFGAPPSAELKGFAFMCLFNTLYPSSI